MRDYRILSQRILRAANSDGCHLDFLREIANMLLDFSECDVVALHFGTGGRYVRYEAVRDADHPTTIRGKVGPSTLPDAVLRSFVQDRQDDAHAVSRPTLDDLEGCLSQVAVPLIVAEEAVGLLQLGSREKGHFTPAGVECYHDLAPTLGAALISQQTRASLRERIKELTCLYGIAQVAERRGVPLRQILQEIVEYLPPAWQYSEIAVAQIVLDDNCYQTANFDDFVETQMTELVIAGQFRGCVEVGYTQEKPDLDEGPFLNEERSLIDTVARQIVVLVERRQAAKSRRRLKSQLRHADRLATIGQLSAGVAHELNEPLGNILAFAQLAGKESGLPEQVARDLGKIVKTALHAREIIKKLMLFARQMPPQKTRLDLNAVVEEGLSFFESRCAKDGVTIERHLAPHLPQIVADPSQLHQVLVNLVVNAIHAMSGGGRLKIATRAANRQVVLDVEDTGVGMSADVVKKIFVPFFTTKDVNEGTGLGLPVVHGIVTSHGGTVSVESTPGRGSRFEVRFPQAPPEQTAEGLPR
jgi:signal transduction histidine kinase